MNRRSFIKVSLSALAGVFLPKIGHNTLPVGDRSAGVSNRAHFPFITQGNGKKRIYIAPDDHTDYFWSGGEAEYRQAFSEMIEYYLDLTDATENNQEEYQSRWNCDGSFWLWVYEKDRPDDFGRLISRIKDGHISAPLNSLVTCLGGAPAEAVIRGMYYPGRLERQYGIRFPVAIAMENQTLPYGLISLWSGSGALFSWKGICGCDTLVPSPWDREHEIYWAEGPDGSKVLMKWYSNLNGYQGIGSYAEARNTPDIVEFVDADEGFKAKYPFNVIGVFGKGWDDFKTLTDEFVTVAQSKSSDSRQVIVSNQVDFFQDFYKQFGSDLPSVGCTFGNEWDLYCAALAEPSAQMKRGVEKLRTAEAMAALVSEKDPLFMNGREQVRENAWMAFGLFWEHNFGMVNPQVRLVNERIAWQKRLANDLSTYVDTLHADAAAALGDRIARVGTNEQFFVFNALGWARDGFADYPFNGSTPVHVLDLASQQEAPSQLITVNGGKYLRILVTGVPAAGYKVYEVRLGEGQSFTDAAEVNGNVIENQFFKITIADRGAVTSLIDKTLNNREFVREIDGRAVNDLGPGSGTLALEHSGPVSVTMKAVSDAPVAHTTRIMVIKDIKAVFIQNEITQNFDTLNTWGFGFDIQNPDVWHEEVGAVIRAKTISQGGHYSDRVDNARYDWLTINHFADMSDGDIGVTVSNPDCYFMKLGNSSPNQLDTETSMLSILAGGKVVSDGGFGLPRQGDETYFLQRFALHSHSAADNSDAMKFALEHQNPMAVGKITGSSILSGPEYSFLQINNPSIFLWSVKPAEDGPDAGTIVRLWNLSNSPQDFSLSHADGPLLSALRLTHIETPAGSAQVISGSLVDSLRPQQIRTYAISRTQNLTAPSAFEEFPVIPPVPAVPLEPAVPSPTPGLSAEPTSESPGVNGDVPATPAGPVFTPEQTSAATQPPTGAKPSGKGCLLGIFGF